MGFMVMQSPMDDAPAYLLLMHTRQTIRSFAASSSSAYGDALEGSDSYISLNNIADNPGARKKV